MPKRLSTRAVSDVGVIPLASATSLARGNVHPERPCRNASDGFPVSRFALETVRYFPAKQRRQFPLDSAPTINLGTLGSRRGLEEASTSFFLRQTGWGSNELKASSRETLFLKFFNSRPRHVIPTRTVALPVLPSLQNIFEGNGERKWR